MSTLEDEDDEDGDDESLSRLEKDTTAAAGGGEGKEYGGFTSLSGLFPETQLMVT